MRIRVEGGHPLNGVYLPSGNKNSAVALLAASLLTDEVVTLHNIPKTTTSTKIMLGVAQKLGAEISFDADNTLKIQTKQITQRQLSKDETNGFVGTMMYLVPILIRRQYVRVELDFPLNRIRTHLDALRDLGIDVVTSDGAVECRVGKWGYKDIILTQTSVTATAVVLMLASTLGKETVIHNAASEPHIQELANLLELMGAQIQGVGSNVLRVFGKPDLHGAKITIGADHIEASSIAAFSALCGGRTTIEGIKQQDLRVIDKIYQRLGINLDIDDTTILVPRHNQLAISNREEDVDSSIETAPWPGFPSDLVATATVIATQARGTSLIHEKLFNNRLLFIDKLNAMGAQIILCDPHRAIVIGPMPLRAIYMDTPDVRTGLGLLGAALIADGESVIDNAEAINNSFEGIITKLQALGAKITIER